MLLEEMRESFSLRYLGEGEVPSFITIDPEKKVFEIFSEDEESLGFYLFEYSGCNKGGEVTKVFLKV